jgi:HSP20 family protein
MLGFDPFFGDLDRLTQALWGPVVGTPSRPAVMAMDARREGDAIVVAFDLPGITADSLDVSIDHGVLTVRGERPAPVDGHNWLLSERPNGVFSRQLHLDSDVDADKITAEYTDGVLQLTIPVAEAAKPRKIAVVGGAQKALSV